MTYHTRFTISTLFFFYVYRPHPDPPSFPTRRSSDLVIRTAIGKVQMELPTCTTGLVIPNAIGYWRQYESDRDMQISGQLDRKSTRLNSSHTVISYAVFCLKKKKKNSEIVNTNIKR